MPTLISRQEALRRIRAEGGIPDCLMCAIIDRQVGDVHTIYEDDTALVMLPRYVRRWGHIMIVPKAHVLTFTELSASLWAEITGLALHAAQIVERVMQPRRCYLASTGSSAGELTQTSRHLHVHVIPLYESDDRPRDIFSWSEGVYTGSPSEWNELRAAYVQAWV